MQVTENILDPQYRKRKSPTQRHHAYVEDRLPAAYAAQGPRAMSALTVESTATRRSKGARNILRSWSASFFCTPGSAAAANLPLCEDSVPETGFYGTEYACRAQKGFLGYATHLQRPAEQPTPQTVDSLLPHRTHLQCAKRPYPKSRNKKAR